MTDTSATPPKSNTSPKGSKPKLPPNFLYALYSKEAAALEKKLEAVSNNGNGGGPREHKRKERLIDLRERLIPKVRDQMTK